MALVRRLPSKRRLAPEQREAGDAAAAQTRANAGRLRAVQPPNTGDAGLSSRKANSRLSGQRYCLRFCLWSLAGCS